MENVSIKEFYKDICGDSGCQLDYFLDSKSSNDMGHFNVFDIVKFYYSGNKKSEMTYNRRLYYKISLIKGKNLVEYADKTVLIDKQGILFATQKFPIAIRRKANNRKAFFACSPKSFYPNPKPDCW
jgi:AraC family transcriptional regulator, transcriptional activator of pobA